MSVINNAIGSGPKTIKLEGQAAVSKAREDQAKYQLDQEKFVHSREIGVIFCHHSHEIFETIFFSIPEEG